MSFIIKAQKFFVAGILKAQKFIINSLWARETENGFPRYTEEGIVRETENNEN